MALAAVLRSLAVTACSIAALAQSAFAQTEGGAASLSITFTVVPSAAFELKAAPCEVEVTLADVRRGFIDVAPIVVDVQVANVSDEDAMQAFSRNPAFPRVRISESGDSDENSPIGIRRIAERSPARLSSRLFLGRNTRPGRYPLDLEFVLVPGH